MYLLKTYSFISFMRTYYVNPFQRLLVIASLNHIKEIQIPYKFNLNDIPTTPIIDKIEEAIRDIDKLENAWFCSIIGHLDKIMENEKS